MAGTPTVERLGRYRLLGRLGRGGMATVYHAVQEGPLGFENEVAIKLVHQNLIRSHPHVLKMLVDEARVAARIRHPNVVRILDLVEEDKRFYLVMDFVDGVSMREVLDTARRLARPPPIGPVLEVLAAACEGLHAAHLLARPDGSPAGLVHRDVKPGNLLVSPSGEVKVSDFGIALFADRTVESTMHGQLKGTPAYMSPEQARGEKLDARSDVFGMGLTLYTLATTKLVFPGDGPLAVVAKIASEPLDPHARELEGLAKGLGTVFGQACARDPGARYQSAVELGRALREVWRGLPRPASIAEMVVAAGWRPVNDHSAPGGGRPDYDISGGLDGEDLDEAFPHPELGSGQGAAPADRGYERVPGDPDGDDEDEVTDPGRRAPVDLVALAAAESEGDGWGDDLGAGGDGPRLEVSGEVQDDVDAAEAASGLGLGGLPSSTPGRARPEPPRTPAAPSAAAPEDDGESPTQVGSRPGDVESTPIRGTPHVELLLPGERGALPLDGVAPGPSPGGRPVPAARMPPPQQAPGVAAFAPAPPRGAPSAATGGPGAAPEPAPPESTLHATKRPRQRLQPVRDYRGRVVGKAAPAPAVRITPMEKLGVFAAFVLLLGAVAAILLYQLKHGDAPARDPRWVEGEPPADVEADAGPAPGALERSQPAAMALPVTAAPAGAAAPSLERAAAALAPQPIPAAQAPPATPAAASPARASATADAPARPDAAASREGPSASGPAPAKSSEKTNTSAPAAATSTPPEAASAASAASAAAPSASESASPAAPSGPGFLTVNSYPYSHVYVDGTDHGNTPIVRLEVVAGNHTVRLVFPSAGDTEMTRTVTVEAGQEARVVQKLPAGAGTAP